MGLDNKDLSIGFLGRIGRKGGLGLLKLIRVGEDKLLEYSQRDT